MYKLKDINIIEISKNILPNDDSISNNELNNLIQYGFVLNSDGEFEKEIFISNNGNIKITIKKDGKVITEDTLIENNEVYDTMMINTINNLLKDGIIER